MANEELKKHISELQRLMERSKLDREDQNFLGNLMSEIVKGTSAKSEPAEKQTFLQNIEQKAVKLEGEHPKLAGALRQVGKVLSDMGI